MIKIPYKKYIQRCESYYGDISKTAPVLWKYVFSKRYILPNYRQPDYSPQAVWDWMIVDAYRAYMEGTIPLADHVSAHLMNSITTAFYYGRPIMWLERELGEPMVRQKLPMDYYTEQINWRWPAFRVYLPKGLLTITRGDQVDSLAYMDITRVNKGRCMDIPKDLEAELRLMYPGIHGKVPVMNSSLEGMTITGMIDMETSTGPVGYAASCLLEHKTIQDLMSQMHEEIPAPLKSDELDIELQNRMLKLGINILLFLSALPIEYESKEVIRVPHKEGSRQISGLYPARFVGESQLRARARHVGPTVPTGRHVVGHWRCGHWKQQPCGPKSTDRKWIWVNMYGAGGFDTCQR